MYVGKRLVFLSFKLVTATFLIVDFCVVSIEVLHYRSMALSISAEALHFVVKKYGRRFGSSSSCSEDVSIKNQEGIR